MASFCLDLYFFRDSFIFHLLKMNLFHLKCKLFEQACKNLLIVKNRLGCRFVKIDPNLNAVTTRVVELACYKSKSVDFLTELEILSQKEKS